MARSMTAFARLEATGSWGRAVWELRSVNHRYVEIGLRLPDDLRNLEGEVRSRISNRLKRGKIDGALRLESAAGTAHQIKVNLAVVRQVIGAAQQVTALLPQATAFNPMDILRWPQVLELPEVDHDVLAADMLNLLDRTLEQMIAARQREGDALQAVVLQRCTAMADIARAMRIRVPDIITAIRNRHTQRIQELALGLDPARLEQECALLVQRLDVAEELDRLDAHLAELQRVMQQPESIGRRLDFLLQELNREANTLGSKSAHIDTSGAAVELKVLIEQIREQIQNIE